MRARNRSARQAYLLLSILIVFSIVEFTLLKPISATSPIVFTRTPSDDTYIDPWNNGTAWGLSNILNATTDSKNRTTMIFLKFDLSGLPSNALVKVINITLTLTLTSSIQKADALAVYGETNNTWAENTLKYPAAPFRNISSFPNDPKTVVSGSTIWNITSLVEPMLGIKTTTSLVLHHFGPNPTSTTMLIFSSKEGNPPPTLIVTYRKNPSSITTILISSPTTVFGSPVIINATLKPAMQTGTIAIQFSFDNQTWSNIIAEAPGISGTVTALWSPPVATPSTYYIRSTWSGDSFTQNAISQVKVLTVSKAATTTSLFLSAPDIGFGNRTLVIANIRPQLSDGVMLIEYSTDLGANWAQISSGPPTNGIAFQQFFPSLTGTYLFRARWLGDANYNASSSLEVQLTVTKAQTSLSLSVSPVAVPVGSTAIISGSLSASGGGALSDERVAIQIGTTRSPAGTTIFSNLTVLTTGIDGSFAFPWVANSNGTYTVRAYFNGTNTYSASTSRIQDVSVGVQIFPTASQVGLISGFVGFFIGLGVSFLVRFRRQVTVKRRQRYGGTRTKGEQSQRQ